jgi:hypothetical protein
VDDSLEEGAHNPVQYEDNEYEELVLNDMDHVAFAVANNPFYKLDTPKFYPEALVINKEGKILARIGECEADSDAFSALKFRTNFRDDKMRLNDDMKIEMKLSEFTDPSTMVVFMMKTYDLRKEKDLPENLFNEAWFRLQNETTSQTLDYTKVRKIAVPDDYVEGDPADEEAEDPADRKVRNELIYLAGRLYCEKNEKTGALKWIYEKWNQLVTSDKYADGIHNSLNDLYKNTMEELAGYEEQIAAAHQRMAEAAEEKRQAVIAAQSKKKATGGKKKKGDDDQRETPAPEDKPNGRDSMLKSAADDEEDDVQYDLFRPSEFSMALKKKFGRRFTFGPVDFNDLNKEFDGDAARKMVVDALEKSTPFKQPGAQVCVHGHKVQVKERTLRRGTSLLKHSRFLNNLEVVPVYPPEPEPVAEANEEAEEGQEEGQE